jgi:hypothetical protein
MENQKSFKVNRYDDGTASVLRKAVVVEELRFYQRSDVLYQLTQLFCRQYLPQYGDRTVDHVTSGSGYIVTFRFSGSSD